MCFIGFHLPDVDLSGWRFEDQVYFERTVFHGRAVFKNATFAKNASFRECTFEQASFELARFGDSADFLRIKVGQSLTLSNSVFSSLVQLSACTIQSGDFRYVEFSEATIRESEFKGRTNFDYARFGGHCDLNGSSFDHVSFRNAQFTTASISGVGFYEKGDFGLAVFERPKNVRFNSDLTRVSFLETDLLKVRFGSNTVWNRGSDPIPYDVREFKPDSRRRLGGVLSVLRDLRDNYEYRLEYEGAGKFFVQEMEMKRQYEDVDGGSKIRSRCWRWFSLTRVYGLSCRYGESLWRPSVAMAAVFGVFFAVFLIDETLVDQGTCPLTSDKWSYALTRTLSGLLQFGCQAPLDYALRALSIPILGTMFVVLRRRFERRFRH